MEAEKLDLAAMEVRSAEISNLEQTERKVTQVASVVLLLIGAFLLVVSIASGEFRDAHGALSGRFVLPLSAGVGLCFLGAMVGTKWRAFAAWFLLVLVGGSAALQMIDAGRLIHFQHYRLPGDLLQHHLFELTVLGFQTIFVGYYLGRHLRKIASWLRFRFCLWKLAVAMVFLVFAGAALTPDVKVYGVGLLIGAWIQLVSLGTVVLMVWSVPKAALERFAARVDELLSGPELAGAKRPSLDRFAFILAIWIMLLASAFSYFVYQAQPHVPDEAQYLFQARYMAAGQLTVTPPQVPEAFSLYMVPFRGSRWFGIFPPGWPAMLAVGVWAGVEWLVNPILAGVCILLAYLFFQQVYETRFARIAIVLLSFSPWFIFMGMNFMGHMFTLAAALGAAVIVLYSIETKRNWGPVIAGFLVGIVSLIRPLDGAIVAVLLGLTVLFRSADWKQRILSGAALVLGTVATASIVLPYDRAVTGNAFLMPLDAYYTSYFWPKVMALGFGPERGMGWGLDAFPGHSPIEALINTALNTSLLQTELLGWGLGSLLLVALLLLSGSMKKRDVWAVGSIVAIIGTYSLFWYHGGPDFGARYWFLSIIPLIALTVRGVEWLGGSEASQIRDPSLMIGRVRLALVSLCLITLVCYIPWRAADKYYHYLGIDPGIQTLAKKYQFGRSLVLIRGHEQPDYQSAWALNPLSFEGDLPLFALAQDPAVQARLRQAYPDRPVWVVDGPSITGDGYRVVAGPIEPKQIPTTQQDLELRP